MVPEVLSCLCVGGGGGVAGAVPASAGRGQQEI